MQFVGLLFKLVLKVEQIYGKTHLCYMPHLVLRNKEVTEFLIINHLISATNFYCDKKWHTGMVVPTRERKTKACLLFAYLFCMHSIFFSIIWPTEVIVHNCHSTIECSCLAVKLHQTQFSLNNCFILISCFSQKRKQLLKCCWKNFLYIALQDGRFCAKVVENMP